MRATTKQMEYMRNYTESLKRQLALEAQCQRMRDLLEEWVSRVPVMPGDPQRVTYNKTNALLAAPLNLELLNFLKQKLINARVMLTGKPKMPTHAADLIDEALKSLSPAP